MRARVPGEARLALAQLSHDLVPLLGELVAHVGVGGGPRLSSEVEGRR